MRATRERERVVERLVAWIWEQQRLIGLLPADDGQQYQVVFRGRTWGERGPDFQGAVLAREDGTLLRGGVEVHVRASDWARHGHGGDAAYNQTIAQVVLWHDAAQPVRRQDGAAIPTLELITRLAAPLAALEQEAQAAWSTAEERRPRRRSSARASPPSLDRPRPARRSARMPHGATALDRSPEQTPSLSSWPAPPSEPAAERATAPSLPSASGAPTRANGHIPLRLAAATWFGILSDPLTACVDEPSDLSTLLEQAGVRRFLEHAARFEGDLACLPAEEVLYRGVARAMGYTANTEGFERLSAALPLATLRAVAALHMPATPHASATLDAPASSRKSTVPHAPGAPHAPAPRRSSASPGPSASGVPQAERRLVAIQAALLGVGGLLPSQRRIAVDAAWPRALDAAWSALAGQVATPLAPPVWRTWRVRPENGPVRRTVGLSQIVAAWMDADPLDALLIDLDEAERAGKPQLLARRWQARATDEFWPRHLDVGRSLDAPRPWLIGAGRAADIVVNVVLPFLYALGQARSDARLSERALALYRAYPSGAPNRVVREMAVQLGGADGPRAARGACRQQGLIHLYRHWCGARDCRDCPAGTAEHDHALA